jgi:hypothetical protein
MDERAYDDQGRVRPADARWLGDANDDQSAEQMQAAREQQIADNTARRAEQRAAEEKANQERLEQAGYVNVTTPEYQEQERRRLRGERGDGGTPEDGDGGTPEAPLSEMLEHPEAQGADVVDTTAGGDVYDEMQFGELQQTAKSRGLSGAGNADELRARLRESDTSGHE